MAKKQTKVTTKAAARKSGAPSLTLPRKRGRGKFAALSRKNRSDYFAAKPYGR